LLRESNDRPVKSFGGIGLSAVAAVAAAAAIFGAPSGALAQSGPPSGSVTLHVGQAGYIGAVSKGGGVLHFRGHNYPFEVAGAGVGGVGITRFDGQGPVYNLTSLAEFAGPFAQVRTGLAIGFRGKGKMMLRNRHGVVMQLAGTRKGLALSTGADAMVVSFAR
jgi:hypothetical protein